MEKITEYNNGRKSEILAMMNDASLCPILEESKIGVSNYTKLPVEKLATLGVAFQPLTAALQLAVDGAGGSGLYYVNTAGKTMFQMKENTNYIGSLQTAAGTVGGGQAQMTPFACDPTMLFVAAALANIEKKLDDIKEIQQEMMDFLVQKEKSKLKGSLTFLYDVYNNYKYHWNNKIYKQDIHVKVLDIRQMAEEKIDFYRSQIIAKVNKKSFLHINQTVNKQLEYMQERFKEYQLALYLLGFSSFLEIVLLENYNPDYLNDISKKLREYSLKYRELYTLCYDETERYSSSSVQANILKGLSKTSKSVGKFIEKIPVVSNGQVDETLIAASNKFNDYSTEKVKKQMQQLIESQSNSIKPFLDNIDTVNKLYNKPVQLVVDKDNFYIATIA